MNSFNSIQLKSTASHCTTCNLYSVTEENPGKVSLTLFQKLNHLRHDIILDIFFEVVCH